MRPGRLAILLLVSLAVACSESRNLTGKWVVEKMLPAPGGAPAGGPMMDVVLDLHQEGTALTGTLVGHMGDVPISSGTVNGKDVSYGATEATKRRGPDRDVARNGH